MPHPAGRATGTATEPERLAASGRATVPAWALGLAGAMVALRLVAVAGIRAYVYFDSGQYETLDFSGRYRRPWATPLLYQLVQSNSGRVLVQAVIGGLAWTVLAVVASRWFSDRRVRATVVAAIAGLGLTTQVTNWDTTILSESLAVSLTALLVAAWLAFVRIPTPRSAAWVVAATVPWLFTRQSLLPAAWMVVALALVALIRAVRTGGARRPLAVVVVGLVLVTGWATLSYGRNREVARDNVTFIVVTRIAPEPDRLAWFIDHGMPPSETGEYHFAEMMADPDYVDWLERDGLSVYARHLLTHPWYTLTAPLDDLVGERRSFGEDPAGQETMLSPGESYGAARPVIPEVVEGVLFDPGRTGTITFALALTVIATAVVRDRLSSRWALPLALVAISLAALVVGWHGAASELGRLSLVAALTLRIGLILVLALVAEALIAGRAGPPRRGTGAWGGPETDR